MTKRIVILLVTVCLVLALSSCGHAEVILSGSDASGALDKMNSISEAFLDVHYSVTGYDVQKYDLIEGILTTAPDAKYEYDKQIEELIKQKYQAQPLTDKGLKSIETNGTAETLWKIAESRGSIDIKITSVKTSIKNADVYDKQNDISFKVNLLINGTYYEVNGTLSLVLADNKWMIDNVSESGWSPALPS